MRILVVDDDPNALRLVGYTLEAEGYQVSTAASGSEALAKLAEERQDLVVLDVMMPDMSGLQVCERIRANPLTARLPILILSARGRVADKVSGLKSGADDYLPKPADTSELVARVEALLARASRAAPPRGQVFSLLGAKGGLGTTTTAINLGVLLAQQGRSVCLVELRPGAGTAAPLLGLQPAADLGTLLAKPPDELAEKQVLACLTPHTSGLRLLAAPGSSEAACEITSEFLEALLAHLTRNAECTLLDLPPIWSTANQAAIRRARFTALVAEPTVLGVHSAQASLATLRNWGIAGDLVRLVLINPGSRPDLLTLPAVRKELAAEVAVVVPPFQDAGAAIKAGVPIAMMMPDHLAAIAYKQLADQLADEFLCGR